MLPEGRGRRYANSLRAKGDFAYNSVEWPRGTNGPTATWGSIRRAEILESVENERVRKDTHWRLGSTDLSMFDRRRIRNRAGGKRHGIGTYAASGSAYFSGGVGVEARFPS